MMDNRSQNIACEITPLLPSLQRYAQILMRNTCDADDLLQDCLERVVSKWQQRHHENQARGWVFAILHNLAMTRLSQKRRRGLHIPIDALRDGFLSCPPEQEDALYQMDLTAALGTLSDDHYRVVVLICGQCLSYKDAASVLGVPIGTVMSRLARARERLLHAVDGTIDREPTPGLKSAALTQPGARRGGRERARAGGDLMMRTDAHQPPGSISTRKTATTLTASGNRTDANALVSVS